MQIKINQFIEIRLKISFTFLVPYSDVRCDVRGKTRLDSSRLLFVFIGGSYLIYVICIYLRILVSSMISLSNDVRVV